MHLRYANHEFSNNSCFPGLIGIKFGRVVQRPNCDCMPKENFQKLVVSWTCGRFSEILFFEVTELDTTNFPVLFWYPLIVD